MIRALLVAMTLAACSGAQTRVQYPGAPTGFDRTAADPKALVIADAVLAAMGGRDRWDAAKQIRWSETITHGGALVQAGEQSWDRWNAREYGRLHRGEQDIVVMRELYGDQAVALAAHGKMQMKLPREDTQAALAVAARRFLLDTAALCVPLLVEAPGTKLTYVGPDEIKVELDPKDPARPGVVLELRVDPATHLVTQVEITTAAGTAGFALSQWTDIGGLKFPTREFNLGASTSNGDASEAIAFANIQVGEPDESLYTPLVQ